jgi:hypothetical protein
LRDGNGISGGVDDDGAERHGAPPSLARESRIGLFRMKIRGRLRAMRNLWLAALTTLVACSSSDPLPPPDVRLLVGQDETWSADPAPTRVQVELVEAERRVVIGEATAPASVITIRNPGFNTGTIASFEATGFDGAGTALVRGASVPYVIYNLLSATIPIFVARASTWSRPAENVEHARNFPVVTVLWHQYIIAAGGEGKDLNPAVPDFYDAINWKALTKQPPFARVPKTMVVVGTTLLCIDESAATSIELQKSDRVANEPAPAGLSFAEVAGGQVLELADGTAFVVGATRSTGEPTSKVLRIDRVTSQTTGETTGVLRTVTLATPRRGAAAGVVAGNLVVWGGSAEGAAAEVLNTARDAFSSLPFPPDATAGLGLAKLDGTTALLAGGKDPVTGVAAPFRAFDVTCAVDCAATELALSPTTLQRTSVFQLAAGHLLVTGDSDDGEFHAFSVLATSAPAEIVERPLRERRKGATAFVLPNGQPGVLGGENPETAAPVLSIESFFF